MTNHSAWQDLCTTGFFPKLHLGKLNVEGGCTGFTGMSGRIHFKDNFDSAMMNKNLPNVSMSYESAHTDSVHLALGLLT